MARKLWVKLCLRLEVPIRIAHIRRCRDPPLGSKNLQSSMRGSSSEHLVPEIGVFYHVFHRRFQCQLSQI